MGVNWADYAITKVRYNTAETHIDKVIIQTARDGLGPEVEKSRKDVIGLLDAGKSVITAPPTNNQPGYVDRGQPVRKVPVGGVDYIRSDANNIARDNLENLPRF